MREPHVYFRAYDEWGVPFEFSFLRHPDLDWRLLPLGSIYRSARDAGWRHERIAARLREAIGDLYGPKVLPEFNARLRDYAEIHR